MKYVMTVRRRQPGSASRPGTAAPARYLLRAEPVTGYPRARRREPGKAPRPRPWPSRRADRFCGQPVTSGARGREAAASAAQYVLLGGFASVAAGISAQGLTGFARDNMGLHGAWPYLLFLALDGAAGVCAVLLTRRAARAESGLAPRLAVWGLVAASASFNFTHAPRRPAAPEAFGLMPVIAAILFEFTLRELQLRAGRADRRLAALRWLHPAERVRVQLRLAADDHISAEAATRRVRIDLAARRLYQLRRALLAQGRAARPGGMAARRARLAEHRAHAALIRAGFADQAIAAQVLRQVQVLTRTRDLAARVSLAVSGASHLLAGRLERAGHRNTRPWRAAWRLHQAAAVFANRVMNYTPPGSPARMDDARRIIDDLGHGAQHRGGPEPSRAASPPGRDARTPGAVALGRECFPVLVSRANTRPGAAPAARTPAPPPPHQAPAAARR